MTSERLDTLINLVAYAMCCYPNVVRLEHLPPIDAVSLAHEVLVIYPQTQLIVANSKILGYPDAAAPWFIKRFTIQLLNPV